MDRRNIMILYIIILFLQKTMYIVWNSRVIVWDLKQMPFLMQNYKEKTVYQRKKKEKKKKKGFLPCKIIKVLVANLLKNL